MESLYVQLIQKVNSLEKASEAAAKEAEDRMKKKEVELNRHLKEISDRNNQVNKEVDTGIERTTLCNFCKSNFTTHLRSEKPKRFTFCKANMFNAHNQIEDK